MATIYRFIVEQRASGGDGRKGGLGGASRSPAKKGKAISLAQYYGAGGRGGVEHNRKMRAMNPLVNKMTFGAHERIMRLGRAGAGLIKVNPDTGAFAGLSGSAVAIIIAFIVQMLLKYQKQQRQLAEESNKQNFKMLENGVGQINASYSVETNILTGKLTYNQNK